VPVALFFLCDSLVSSAQETFWTFNFAPAKFAAASTLWTAQLYLNPISFCNLVKFKLIFYEICDLELGCLLVCLGKIKVCLGNWKLNLFLGCKEIILMCLLIHLPLLNILDIIKIYFNKIKKNKII